MTTVEARGTGRKDYSMNIEYIVEPVIRSYQQLYKYFSEYIDFPPLTDITVDVDIPLDSVVFVYDFRLCTFAHVLTGLKVQAIGTDGTIADVTYGAGYTSVYQNIPAGFPFFKTIRLILSNYSDKIIDVDVSMNGMYTAEKEYYLRIG